MVQAGGSRAVNITIKLEDVLIGLVKASTTRMQVPESSYSRLMYCCVCLLHVLLSIYSAHVQRMRDSTSQSLPHDLGVFGNTTISSVSCVYLCWPCCTCWFAAPFRMCHQLQTNVH